MIKLDVLKLKSISNLRIYELIFNFHTTCCCEITLLWSKKSFPEIGELHKKIQWKSQFERALRSPKQEYKWKSCVIDMCTKAIIIAHGLKKWEFIGLIFLYIIIREYPFAMIYTLNYIIFLLPFYHKRTLSKWYHEQ